MCTGGKCNIYLIYALPLPMEIILRPLSLEIFLRKNKQLHLETKRGLKLKVNTIYILLI